MGVGQGWGRGGAHPPSRVLGVVYEHLGVRGHVNIPPTVGELVWVGWQNFLAQSGVNVAALQPALPNVGGGGAVAAGPVGGGRGVREAGRGRGAGGREVSAALRIGSRGGRLTSLDASFARCFAFSRTSSKTSRSMFFQKHRPNIASLRKKHDVFHDVFGFGNSIKSHDKSLIIQPKI